MGWWQVNADTLAGSRFVLSPLAETTASLITLQRGLATHPGEQAWLDSHLPRYRQRLAANQITALLVRVALRRTWIASILTPAPAGEGEPVFGDELARILEMPADAVRADLAMPAGGPLPDQLVRDDLAERAADLLEWVWAESVQPYWPRRGRILEADIVARTAQVSRGGWAAALENMRPGMRWLGERPAADQRVRLSAPADFRGPLAVRPGHTAPRLGVVGSAAPLRRHVSVLGSPGRRRPRAGAGPARGLARARAGPGPRAARHPEEHHAARGADGPGPGVGGTPSEDPA